MTQWCNQSGICASITMVEFWFRFNKRFRTWFWAKDVNPRLCVWMCVPMGMWKICYVESCPGKERMWRSLSKCWNSWNLCNQWVILCPKSKVLGLHSASAHCLFCVLGRGSLSSLSLLICQMSTLDWTKPLPLCSVALLFQSFFLTSSPTCRQTQHSPLLLFHLSQFIISCWLSLTAVLLW